MGMTVPVTCIKYEDKIKRYVESVKVQGRRFCDMVDEKVVKKIMSNYRMVQVKKEKKVE